MSFAASVLIASKNRAHKLEQTLDSLMHLTFRPGIRIEVLVVDNGSSDATRSVVEAAAAKVGRVRREAGLDAADLQALMRESNAPLPPPGSRSQAGESRAEQGAQSEVAPQSLAEHAPESAVEIVYLHEATRGKSAALNTAIEHARSPLFLFTDDDCLPPADWAQKAIDLFEREPDLMMMGGRVVLHNDADASLALVLNTSREALTLQNYTLHLPIIGANMAFRAGLCERIGYFDERLGPGSVDGAVAEDIDIAYRCILAGCRTIFEPDLEMPHHHERQTREAIQKAEKGYFLGRGAFVVKHFKSHRRFRNSFFWEVRDMATRLIGDKDARRRSAFYFRYVMLGALRRLRPMEPHKFSRPPRSHQQDGRV